MEGLASAFNPCFQSAKELTYNPQQTFLTELAHNLPYATTNGETGGLVPLPGSSESPDDSDAM